MITDNLLINLRIISKIQKNGRISRSYDGIVSLENETFYQSIKRFLSSDSRKQSVFEINSIINETSECINNIINSRYMNKLNCNTDEYYKLCEDLELVTIELESSKTGIDNLKFTYKNDPNISSQIDILILKIQSLLKDSNYKLIYFQSALPQIHRKPKEIHSTTYASSYDQNTKETYINTDLQIDNQNDNDNDNNNNDNQDYIYDDDIV
jgi:hypothetical protein